MLPTPKQQLLAYAERHLGRQRLATRLRAPEQSLQLWLDGRMEMPTHAFLALVDAVEEIKKRHE